MGISSDLTDLIKPLIKPEFKEVVEISHRLVKSDLASTQDLKETIVRLAGFLFFAGTMAGFYSAERRRKYAQGIVDAMGTATDKEAIGRLACAEERKYEEIFNNMFMTIKNQIDALKKTVEIKMIELSKSGNSK